MPTTKDRFTIEPDIEAIGRVADVSVTHLNTYDELHERCSGEARLREGLLAILTISHFTMVVCSPDVAKRLVGFDFPQPKLSITTVMRALRGSDDEWKQLLGGFRITNHGKDVVIVFSPCVFVGRLLAS